MPSLMTCARCRATFEREPGPGRLPAYCGVICRRLAEYEIRRLDRRIAGYEIEQRGLKYEGPSQYDDDEQERQKRMRALRKWIAEDEARLRQLVEASQSNQPASPAAPNPAKGIDT